VTNQIILQLDTTKRYDKLYLGVPKSWRIVSLIYHTEPKKSNERKLKAGILSKSEKWELWKTTAGDTAKLQWVFYSLAGQYINNLQSTLL